MSVQEKLELLVNRMNKEPEGIDELQASFTFNITDQEGLNSSVIVDGQSVELTNSVLDNPNCQLTMNEKNFEKLLDGELNTTSAFMMGKLKVKGDLTYALKLQNVLKSYL
ncbi:SCP2 sterol-binding domain-containing protein [Alkalibacillus aidingensis]|uniref:SCP2 sterol-binding domain-containing protein n=1 Tax=Alkalibacillus aidingensis TaxID=2747607 RepID=UPI0016611D6A|nr:SCP2 sterol-binding domain-containing protein [Alkalibacillus aidingensis]